MAHVLPELVSYLEGLPEPHILFDRQYRILAANAAYRRQFAPHGSVVGRTCYEVSHRYAVPCDQAGESCPLARARESGERVLHLHHTPLGEAYVNIELVPLRDAGGDRAQARRARAWHGAASRAAVHDGRAGPVQDARPAARLLREIEIETETLREQLAVHQCSRADLARALGISERSLYRKLRALQIP